MVAAQPTDTAPAKVVHLVPRAKARVDRFERFRTNTQWGDITAAKLISVMQNAAKGEVADWADLCEYMIDTDELLTSLYETRMSRVVQADWIVSPSKYGDRGLAVAARNLCDDLLSRVENFDDSMRDVLHALAPGFSANELQWARDHRNGLNYVASIDHKHGHRFRYDEQWNLRLYDRGMRPGPDGYGERLTRNGWLVHRHRVQAGYPGIAGIMRSVAIKWLFRRWAAKWEVSNLEVHGRPMVYAKVGGNTPDAVREQILTDLENLSSDHYGIMEAGTELVVEASAAASKNYEAFRAFADATKADIVTAWLGFSDAVDPGKHGSQSAVGTRTGFAGDPRMVSDGLSVGSVIRHQLFRPFIELNTHKLGIGASEVGRVPLPEFRLKTAADEESVDIEDLEDERREEGVRATVQVPGEVGRAAAPEPTPSPEPAEPAKTAMQGGQVDSLKGIVRDAHEHKIPRESAIALITAAYPSIDAATADRIVGVIPEKAPAPIPQAPVPPADPPPKSTSPLAMALRGESA